MRNGTAPISGVKRRSSGWRFVVSLVLFAFTLQSYVVQSHIHDRSQGLGVPSVIKFDAKTPIHGNPPLGDTSPSCSICQAIAHAGAVLAPSEFLFLPSLSAEFAAPFVTMRAVAAVTLHDWQSRAPPQR
jgi:hypothetical protein